MILEVSKSPEKIDAVLPITLKDFERFSILKQTLDRFCQNLLNNIWVIVPDSDLQTIRHRIQEANYHVISDSELVPEFNIFPKKGGWFKQQLIKLAIASRIESDFYLTLDADVLCIKSINFSDLIKDGRAVYYQYSREKFEFPEWYDWAYRVLNLAPFSNQSYHNVTPSVLSRDAVLQLQAYLTQCSSLQLKTFRYSSLSLRNKWLLCRTKLAQILLPKNSDLRQQLLGWKAYLLRSVPWTEYSLYYTFCQAQGLLDKYHTQTDHCIYSTELSIWYKDQYTQWNPESWFSGQQKFFFCVVQSTTEISPAEVWQQVKPYL